MKKKVNWKIVGLGVGILAALVLFVAMWFISVNNNTVVLEEQIMESDSAIEVQEKRREDLIVNLVDCVINYTEYEQSTMEKVIAARQSAQNGSIEDAKTAIYAVAEQYPDLKAQQNYDNLMKELATTENLIAEYRNNYNQQIKAYNKYVRRFPNSLMLNLMGYEKLDFEYAQYEASQDSPKNLFGE